MKVYYQNVGVDLDSLYVLGKGISPDKKQELIDSLWFDGSINPIALIIMGISGSFYYQEQEYHGALSEFVLDFKISNKELAFLIQQCC
jgi:hypothetical protein